MTKDTDEQPDEEIPRVRSGKVPSAGASVPVELGCVTLSERGCVHSSRSSPKPMLLGFLCRHDQLLTISSPLPSLEKLALRSAYVKIPSF